MPPFPPGGLQRPSIRYATAIVTVAAAFFLRYGMVRFLSLEVPPFLTFYPAIMFVAVVTGFGPGIVATALASLLADYFILHPVGHFTIVKTSDVVSLGFFSTMGFLMSLFAERYRRNQRAIAAYQEEQALRLGELRLERATEFQQLAFVAADLGTWEFFPESGEVSVDDNCRKLFGFQPGESPSNEALVQRIHPDDQSSVNETIGNAISGAPEGLWGMEYRVLWPDGSTHWLTSHGRVYFTGECDGHRVPRLIGVNMDITARKIAEEARASDRAKLESALSSMTDAVFISDPDGNFIHFNDAFASFHRFRDRSECARTLSEYPQMLDISTAEGDPVPLDMWAIPRALRGERGVNVERRLRRRDSGQTWFGSYSFSPLRGSGGSIFGCVVVARDITEEKKTQAALHQSLEQLQIFVEHAPVALAMFDREMRYICASRRWQSDYGLEGRVLQGLSHYEVFPEISGSWKEAHRRGLAGEVLGKECDEFRRSDGSLQVIRWEIRPWRDAAGGVGGIVIFSEDITERKLAEEHTRKLNRVYTVLSDINQTIVREKASQAMLESACRIAVEKGQFRMAWIGMIDPATRELRPIASSGRVGGYLDLVKIDFRDPATATGPAARCFFSGNHSICNDIEKELSRPWKSDALRNGYRSVASFPLRCDGQITGIFSLYASEIGFFDEDETKVLDEMAMDISYALEVNLHEKERQEAEEELRWRTAFFEAQVDSATDGILVVNGKGQRLLRNQRLLDLFATPQHIAELPVGDEKREYIMSRMKNPEESIARMDQLNFDPLEVSRDEIELVDGKILERCSSPVRDKAGNFYGRIWTFRDITERRQLEEQFRQAQKMEAIGQLTGGIAHDFNNLLTVILGCSEVISEEVKERPQLSKMADMISRAALRGADLTHRMLAFGRRQTLQPKAVNINQLLAEMESFLRRTLSAEIELNVIPGGEKCEVTIDPTQLEGALLNLCLNARDAMPGGGRLTIRTETRLLDADYSVQNPYVQPGHYVLIEVSDTGCGISAENLGRVFDPFFTTKEVGKGTGLGLSMVYGFVKQSQGYVKIYSEPGLGTSVKLYLPQVAKEAEITSQHSTPRGDLKGSEVILLVEDNDSVREFAKLQLDTLGYRVIEAANGHEAMNVMRANNDIDLLFTDMIMPGGMSGRQVAQEARLLNPGLKVLYCSGYAEDTVVQQGLLDETFELLNKPYTRLELATKIRGVLMDC